MKRILYPSALLSIFLLVQVASATVEPVDEQSRAINPDRTEEVGMAAVSAAPQAAAAPSVTLRAASGATIAFETQNGETVDGVAPQSMDLPYLVLYRNGALTDFGARTLIVEMSGIAVPPSGVTVTVEVQTQHGDPDQGGGSGNRITVWRESRRITHTLGATQTGVTVVFTHEFAETTISDNADIATPTDYFRYHIAVTDANHPLANPLYTFSQDYAFLMERQWITQLPAVREASAGAAPDELIVYYCDMFPFRKNKHDPSTWVRREDVPSYVGGELAPAMIEAFRVQSDDWGFTWHDAWTSYRTEDAERLSVALVKGGTWFHGGAPSNGHSGISLRVNGDGYAADYDSPTDALISLFHHELFHNLQKNILQNSGAYRDVNGAEGVWRFFSEGTATLAASVGKTAAEFGPSPGTRHYMDNANGFLGRPGLAAGELNRGYAKMSPYHPAIYWRFLYEQCGGMTNGREDTAAGMDVIRRVLMTLYAKDRVDVSPTTDSVAQIPEIMDQALAGSTCPFKTHRESLNAFARAVYALRLAGGRCIEPGVPTGYGFYDPHHQYHEPRVGTVTYSGSAVIYSGADQPSPAGIKSSFGMDFVDVILDPAADGRPLTLELFGAPGADAEFNVQLIKLVDAGRGVELLRSSTVMAAAETLTATYTDGHLIYVIPAIDTSAYNRLSLIITRVDARESSDPMGAYNIVLHSGTE